MDSQNVVYTYNGTLLGHKGINTGQHATIWDKYQKYAKWKKPDIEGYTYCVIPFIYINYPK